MIVSEMITLLQKFDPCLEVGAVGYYGEFYPMDKYDFYQSSACDERNRKHFKTGVRFKMLQISCPDIGDEPY